MEHLESNRPKYPEPDENPITLEEHCYLKIQRPIPFSRHTRGCFLRLKPFSNRTKIELLRAPNLYEEYHVCSEDDCNDHGLPGAKNKYIEPDYNFDDEDDDDDEED